MSSSKFFVFSIVFLACVDFAEAFVTALRDDVRAFTKLHADNGNDRLNNMRKVLESSWNSETMGIVPSDPRSAAEAAAIAVRNALDRGILVNMVDILLPQYDASQDERLYDEVLAVEFCIELAEKLKTRSSIVVRDDKTIQTVSRILDRREETEASKEDYSEEEERDEGDNINDGGGDDEVFNNDSIDPGMIENAPKDEIDSFRTRLAAEWNKGESSAPGEGPSEPKVPQPVTPIKPSNSNPKPRQYRLCSMLGEAVGMRAGADMQGKVIEAVKANGLPKEDEQTIIILSAASPQELVGIRALVGQYRTTKNMILVNCRVSPLPRELAQAQTVYSILPLIAKQSSSASIEKDNVQPRVVVLRRYPRDWEVFVDSGTGFELAATVPASSALQKGPSLQWIRNAVKRYLGARSR